MGSRVQVLGGIKVALTRPKGMPQESGRHSPAGERDKREKPFLLWGDMRDRHLPALGILAIKNFLEKMPGPG